MDYTTQHNTSSTLDSADSSVVVASDVDINADLDLDVDVDVDVDVDLDLDVDAIWL